MFFIWNIKLCMDTWMSNLWPHFIMSYVKNSQKFFFIWNIKTCRNVKSFYDIYTVDICDIYIMTSCHCHTKLCWCNRDTPLNSNDIVITSKTTGKYSKTVDALQYRVDFIVIIDREAREIMYLVASVCPSVRPSVRQCICTTYVIIGITNSWWWSGHPDKLQ